MGVSEILMKNNQLMKSMMTIENLMSHQIGTIMTTGPDQDHQKTTHTGKDIDIALQIEGIGMIGRSDSSYINQLTSSQCLEVKLFLDKIPYFDGSNNKEALNFLAQCKEAAEKMKASEVTIAWSELAG